MMVVGFLIGNVGGVLMNVHFALGAIVALPAVLTIIGFFKYFGTILKASAIACPLCSKSLGYLFTDSNYTKRHSIWGIPSDVPKTIEVCPYCKAGMDDEISQNHHIHGTSLNAPTVM